MLLTNTESILRQKNSHVSWRWKLNVRMNEPYNWHLAYHP